MSTQSVKRDDILERLQVPGTRIRLNNETYCKFDGTEQVVLQNAFSEAAVRIKFDILLILYELVEWKEIQDLLAPWPPEDQEKIVNYLEMFYRGEMLLIEGFNDQKADEGEATAESRLEAIKNNKVPINVENHHNMLKDNVRMSAYRRAIENSIQPGDTVLDLGAGSGVLSFFASKAGAEKVFAIEKLGHIVDLAKALAEDNGIENIEFIESSSNLVNPSQLQPQPKVMVSEIIGDGILEENILEYTIDARDRLLATGASLIPWKIDILGFAYFTDVQNHQWQECQEFKDLYDLDFKLLGKVLKSKASLRRERYHHQIYKKMSSPKLFRSLDLTEITTSNFNQPLELEIETDGWVSGLCCYFKAWLDKTTTLTNSPWAPSTHWTHLMYNLAEAKPMKKGDKLEIELIYDGALRISVTE